MMVTASQLLQLLLLLVPPTLEKRPAEVLMKVVLLMSRHQKASRNVPGCGSAEKCEMAIEDALISQISTQD